MRDSFLVAVACTLSGCLTKPNPEWGAAAGSTTGASANASDASSEEGSTSKPGWTTAAGGTMQDGDSTTSMSSDATSSNDDGTSSTGGPLTCGERGRGCFGEPNILDLEGDEPRAVLIDDLDRDGRGEIVISYSKSHQLQVIQESGSTPGDLVDCNGQAPWGLAADDLDGEGPLEIASANAGSDSVSLFRFDAQLVLESTFEVGKRPEAIATAHFDEADVDLAIAIRDDDVVAIALGEGSLDLQSENSFDFLDKPEGIATGDFDGDGFHDVVTASHGAGVIIRLGDGSGGFATEPSILGAGGHYMDVAAGDFDGDGATDFAAVTHEVPQLHLWWGDGLGDVEDPAPAALLLTAKVATPSRLAAGDVDADGRIDFAVVLGGSNEVALVRGTGPRSFALPESLPTPATPWDVALGHLDEDAFLDIAVTLPDVDQVALFVTLQ